MKIALIGYGKMGKEIEKIAVARGHEIVSIIDVDNRQDFASEAFRSADVAIEFTAPSVAYGNCLEAFKNWLDGRAWRRNASSVCRRGKNFFLVVQF